ncbi:ORF87 [white sturgeon herpesvirus 2]|uniref:ORF88 n=1 Tax=white sturgeon herpesvirus 2 TaxID=320884 RepID=F6GQ91_9VIRU|nr:ORF87 [Acipenserid herpesvirus 2]AEF97711.1 ORF87 [Acipenserid herpesvirus 2]
MTKKAILQTVIFQLQYWRRFFYILKCANTVLVFFLLIYLNILHGNYLYTFVFGTILVCGILHIFKHNINQLFLQVLTWLQSISLVLFFIFYKKDDKVYISTISFFTTQIFSIWGLIYSLYLLVYHRYLIHYRVRLNQWQ